MRRAVSPEQTRWILTLFEQVVSLDPSMRAAHLDEACADDPDLRHEVELLLEHYDRTGSTDAPGEAVNALRASWPEASQVQPGHQVSHYQVLEQLGGGGMGVVFKARDRRLDRTVALKFLPSHLSLHEEAKERFIREAKAASALDHVNICTIYDIGATDQGQLFIAMACYEGETLKEKIARGRLPVMEALGYAVQIAEGLQAAHEVGIVHRDVKPANVMVTDRGVVKLLDFGIAKAADAALTRTGVTPGTAAYMSPEQTRGEDVDGRTDLWSLGVVLYEMLTGQRPFQGHYEQAVIYSILHEDPESVTALRAEVPQALAAIVRRALAKNRAHRYADMASLLAALRAVRQGRDPAPGAPSVTSQTMPSIAVLPFADMSPGRDQSISAKASPRNCSTPCRGPKGCAWPRAPRRFSSRARP